MNAQLPRYLVMVSPSGSHKKECRVIAQKKVCLQVSGFFIKTDGKVTYKLPVYLYDYTRVGDFQYFQQDKIKRSANYYKVL